MIEIKVNKEIRDIKGKIWMGLTVREIFCIAVVILLGIAVGFIIDNKSLRTLVSCIVSVPVLAIGFLRPYGMPVEKFMVRIFESLISSNKPLKFVSVKEEELDVYKSDRKKKHDKNKNAKVSAKTNTSKKHK